MKRGILFAGIVLALLLTATSQEHETKMQSIFADNSESARLQHIKSAMDMQDNIHLVFIADRRELMYGTNKSGSWVFEKLWYVDRDYNDTISAAFYPNIVVDKNNSIHLAMFGHYQEKLYYASKPLSGEEFLFEEVQFSPDPLRFRVYGDYTNMAVDKNGGLHLICKADYTDQKDFKYNQCAVYLNKRPASDKWDLQVLVHDPSWDENNFRFGTDPSIACYDDMVYVVLGGDNDLHFGSRNIAGGTWDIESLAHTSDEVINSAKYMTSLAISNDGTIKFAFHDRSEDENAGWQGLTVFSQEKCGKNGWQGYNGWEWPRRLNCPAIAINKNGKSYLAVGQNEFALYEQACDCDGEYKLIYEDDGNSSNFVDMLIDKQNKVHAFFTSDYDNKLHYLTAQSHSGTEICNYPPTITGYTGKTNVGPGEEWTGSISATDAECDKIDFYAIILPEYVSINDHGDGTVTIKANVPEGDGFGDVGFSVFVRDDKHQDVNGEMSVITFMLKLTQEGKEEGHITVENKCSDRR